MEEIRGNTRMEGTISGKVTLTQTIIIYVRGRTETWRSPPRITYTHKRPCPPTGPSFFMPYSVPPRLHPFHPSRSIPQISLSF